MPQLSLYIDKKTLSKLEIAAEIEHLSLSKYAVKKLNESMHAKWPDKYENLFGSVDDSSFNIVRDVDFKDDAEREDV